MSNAELIDVRRKKMGMVFQHFALLPHLTVLQNAAFPLEIQGVGQQEREERARQMIETVGLKGRENHYPPGSFPAGNSRGLASPGRWSPTRTYGFWTSLSRRWTPP